MYIFINGGGGELMGKDFSILLFNDAENNIPWLLKIN